MALTSASKALSSNTCLDVSAWSSGRTWKDRRRQPEGCVTSCSGLPVHLTLCPESRSLSVDDLGASSWVMGDFQTIVKNISVTGACVVLVLTRWSDDSDFVGAVTKVAPYRTVRKHNQSIFQSILFCSKCPEVHIKSFSIASRTTRLRPALTAAQLINYTMKEKEKLNAYKIAYGGVPIHCTRFYLKLITVTKIR